MRIPSAVAAALLLLPQLASADDAHFDDAVTFPGVMCTGSDVTDRSKILYDVRGAYAKAHTQFEPHDSHNVECPIVRDADSSAVNQLRIFRNLKVFAYNHNNGWGGVSCIVWSGDQAFGGLPNHHEWWTESEDSTGNLGDVTLTFSNSGMTETVVGLGDLKYDPDWYITMSCGLPNDGQSHLKAYQIDYPDALEPGGPESLDTAINYPFSACVAEDATSRGRLWYSLDYLRNDDAQNDAAVICPLLRDRANRGNDQNFLSDLKVYVVDNSGNDMECKVRAGDQGRVQQWLLDPALSQNFASPDVLTLEWAVDGTPTCAA